jgi:hypothetical protein
MGLSSAAVAVGLLVGLVGQTQHVESADAKSAAQSTVSPGIQVPDNVLSKAREVLSDRFGVSGVDATVVQIPRSAANQIYGGASTSDNPKDDLTVDLVVISSSTTLTMSGSTGPQGSANPTGHIATMTIDPSSGLVLDLGLSDWIDTEIGPSVASLHVRL